MSAERKSARKDARLDLAGNRRLTGGPTVKIWTKASDNKGHTTTKKGTHVSRERGVGPWRGQPQVSRAHRLLVFIETSEPRGLVGKPRTLY